MHHNSFLVVIALMLSFTSAPALARDGSCNYAGWGMTAAISGGLAAISLIFLSVAAAADNGASYGWQQQCAGSSGSICCTPPPVTFTTVMTTAPAGSNTTTTSATTAPALPTSCTQQPGQSASCPSGQLLYCPGGSTTPAPYVQKDWVQPMRTAGIVCVSAFGGFSAFVLFIMGVVASVECC